MPILVLGHPIQVTAGGQEAILGVALGGTNVCVAVRGDREVEVIPNVHGNRTTPAMVAFLDSGEHLIGELAKRQAVVNPGKTIRGLRRLLGRRLIDEETSRYAQTCEFGVVPSPSGDAWVAVRGKCCPPEHIVALLLDQARQAAASHLGSAVRGVVIGVPLWFGHAQRHALRHAARTAGLEIVGLIDEPRAAALAHDAARRARGGRSRHVAVYDLGGSSLSVAVLERRGDDLAVVAAATDRSLGGRDFDTRIVDALADQFQDRTGIDLRADPLALQRLREAAETVKHELSSDLKSVVNLPFVAADEGGARHLTLQLSRRQLETLVDDLLERTVAACREVLDQAGLTVTHIDELLLVGGQTRMPRVRELVATFFRRAPAARVSPDEAVAIGAALDGARLGAALPLAAPVRADVVAEDRGARPAPVDSPPTDRARRRPAPAEAPIPAAYELPEDVPLPMSAPVAEPAAGGAPAAASATPELADCPPRKPPAPALVAGIPWVPEQLPGPATGTREPPPPAVVAPRAPRRGLLYLMIGATAILMLWWPAMVLVRRHHRGSVVLVEPASASASTQTIPILVDVRPPTAMVELDGVELPAPWLAVPRDGRRHTLRFTARGHVPQEVWFNADQIQSFRLELTRLPDESDPGTAALGAPSAAGAPRP